jgi:AGCS family alanine or glycine:cation symporter
MLDFIIQNPILALLLLGLFVMVGLWSSVRLGFPQFVQLKVAASETLGAIRESSMGSGGLITPFQASMLGQAFVLGNGQVLGTMTAILAGGPGAVLWMWVGYLLGMVIQFAEAILAVHFRRQFADKGVSGGPIQSIARGLGERFKGLAWVYALLISGALLGTGALFQSGTASNMLYAALKVPPALTALVLAIGIGVLSIGGIRSLAKAAVIVVPLSLGVFLLAVVPLLVVFAAKLPAVVISVFGSAFSFKAALGGAAGLAIVKILAGLGQGLLASTAGLGLTSMALSQAQVDHPVRQGFWGLMLMLVSLAVSTLTALVFLASGVWQGGADALSAVSRVFESHFLGSNVLAVLVLLFALGGLMASVFLGEEGFVHILGDGFRIPYRVIFATMVFIGPLGGLQAFMGLSYIALALAGMINLAVLLVLGKVVAGLMQDFFNGEAWFPPGDASAKKPRKVKPKMAPHDESELLEA